MTELFDTGTILIVVAFATAVIGTLWDARPWGKALMIVLALVAAGTAIHESSLKSEAAMQARQEARTAQRNLELLIRSVQPPEIFVEAVFDQIQEAAGKKGLYISTQSILEEGERIFGFGTKQDQTFAGSIVLTPAVQQRLFVSFARQDGFSEMIEAILFGSWGSDSLDDDWNLFALNTYNIARNILLDHVPDGTSMVGAFGTAEKTVSVSVVLPDGTELGSIEFDSAFMSTLPGLPPLERGRAIHQHTESQIVD
ncbi:MAG: hypothetical protein P1U37_14275 [Minwuia sp.]|nr:hypothetical protein [Minwuia sp.]